MLKHLSYIAIAMLMALPHGAAAQGKPISLHPGNPHYFARHGKPVVLITSGEHYGAVLNLDFEYVKYLDELASRNLNLTRIFTGAYVEPDGAFNIERNTLAPITDRFIAPWARADEPGYKGGGNKFDLSRWDEAYFTRLKSFMDEAQRRNIIVELALFCPFYENMQWALSPMHASNNVNNINLVGKDSVHTLDKSGKLLGVQESLVKKIVQELNSFDNLIFEICNEPYFGGVTMEWQHHIATLISQTEKTLPFRHLISQNIANDSGLIRDPHPDVSVFNFHYATPPTAVKQNYHLNKVIGDNETGFKGQADSTYRKEGWEIIMAGGALYNNLDYSFAAGYEDGTFRYHAKQPGGGSVALREQLGIMRKFIEGFDFVAMKPDAGFSAKGIEPLRMHMLSEKGKQYGAYLLHGRRATVTLELPAGSYTIEWVDPASGKRLAQETFRHRGNEKTFVSPDYEFDIAMRIVNGKSASKK